MKISIVIHSNTAATVTRLPSWLERWLLGRTESTRAATHARMHETFGGWTDPFGPRMVPIHGWLYDDTGREVESHVAGAIDRTLTLRAVRARLARVRT